TSVFSYVVGLRCELNFRSAPGTGLALAYVPIRYLEIIISVDMDEYKNIYVISQKHTGLREV
ncbi:hypothetical protein, partial [Escherichia coli]|uniref:hypothetical protein n=1 Tax=Escherichia coli TaxID=562 RepID=UPI001A7E1B26